MITLPTCVYTLLQNNPMVFLKIAYVNTCFIVSYVFLKCWMGAAGGEVPFQSTPPLFLLETVC